MAVKLGALDEDRMSKLRDFAKSKNWSPSDFKDILDFYHSDLSEGIDSFGEVDNERRAAAGIAAKEELRKIPGWQTEAEYTDKVRIAQSVMEKYELIDSVEELNLQNSPKLVVGLNKIADSMSEDTLKGLGAPSGDTLDNINTQIADLRNQQNVIRQAAPVNFKSDAKFKDIEKRLKGLYQKKPA